MGLLALGVVKLGVGGHLGAALSPSPVLDRFHQPVPDAGIAVGGRDLPALEVAHRAALATLRVGLQRHLRKADQDAILLGHEARQVVGVQDFGHLALEVARAVGLEGDAQQMVGRQVWGLQGSNIHDASMTKLRSIPQL